MAALQETVDVIIMMTVLNFGVCFGMHFGGLLDIPDQFTGQGELQGETFAKIVFAYIE